MTEDKLDHDERLRLECLAQAVASAHMSPLPMAEVATRLIIDRAKKFEEFVKGD